jgi:hypothetical protein
MTWRRLAPIGAGWAVAAMLATAPSAARQPPAAAGQIAGTVKSAADGAPVARARVAAAPPGSQPYVTLTSADGTFVLRDLPPAAYTLTVTRTGYATYTHGQGRRAAAMPVSVAAGQSIANVGIVLAPGRSVVGRILDDDGSPFAGAVVEALVARSDGGRDALVTAATASTDDRGEFRLHGLAPGEYVVSAADPALTDVATSAGIVRYPPTYYPGVGSTAEATAVIVPAASDPPRLEFRLKLVRPARVSGRLSAHDGGELLSAAILMTAIDGRGAAAEAPGDPSIAPDGRFSFGHVAPGRYQIRARAETAPDRTLFALTTIDVQGNDIDGIQMTLQPGARIEGTLVVDARSGLRPPPFSAWRVRAPSIDGSRFGDATGTVAPDGSFALRGVGAGAHQIVVEGLTPPWTLKQVLYRGADVTDRIVEVGAKEQTHGVRVTITDVTTVVAGVVEDLRRRPVPNAGVLIFSRTPLHWIRTNRHMRAAYTDPDGRFTISGLPAGQYVAIATMDADESDLGRRDRLRRLEPLGTPLQLDAADARATLTLTLRGDR